MFLFGVTNASPDSLNTDSIVSDAESARERGRYLLANGCEGIDLGGQGSTDNATVVSREDEWNRLRSPLSSLASLRVPISIDSWRPEIARLALTNGATVLNAADGMQASEMWEVAAEFEVPVVLPFLSGPNPRAMQLVDGDPLDAMVDFFAQRLKVADRFGLRGKCMIDPGTGFAPSNWPWRERFLYQKHVYSNLNELRRFKLPLYLALPWKESPEHDELLEIALRQEPEFGRVHYPIKVKEFQRRLLHEAT